MQSTSCKMSVWMTHQLESRLPGEISTTSDMQMIPLVKGIKESLGKGERGERKSWIKTQHSKNWDHGICPNTSWQIDGGKKWKLWQTLFLGAPKSLQMGTTAMKLKDVFPGSALATFWTGDHFSSLGLDFLILNTQQWMALTLRSLLFLCTNNSRSESTLSARKCG